MTPDQRTVHPADDEDRPEHLDDDLAADAA
jgi:hypothetical protein